MTQSIERDDAIGVAPLAGLVGFNVRMAQIRIFEDFARRMERLDLRPSEYSVLGLIRRNPGCRASQVAEALSIKRPNVVVLLAALEGRALVTRRRSLDDRRVFHLHLTRHGQAFLKKADGVVAAQEKRIAQILGEAGKAELLAMLTRLQALPSQD